MRKKGHLIIKCTQFIIKYKPLYNKFSIYPVDSTIIHASKYITSSSCEPHVYVITTHCRYGIRFDLTDGQAAWQISLICQGGGYYGWTVHFWLIRS